MEKNDGRAKEKEKENNSKLIVEPLKKETFIITAYCPCYECSEGYGRKTSTGVNAKSQHTIAVDPDIIPYGSKVIIDNKTYIAEDCGGAIKGNMIDIFFDTHEETIKWGRQTKQVTIMKGE